MRKPAFRKARKGMPTSQGYSLPAPTGGWNARDSVATMKETDAIVMDNLFPDTNDVIVRKGYSQHVTGGSVFFESLMVYNAPDGTQSLFAAHDTAFYNVTSSGALGAAVQSSLTNARWQWENFTNSGGTSYLCCFNGADSPRYWDGSSWTTITGVSSPAITGITTSDIVNVAVHKRRMWLVINDSLKAYYLPVDAVGGAANAIDLGGIANKGGYIMAIGTWTIDGGEGIDDYWAAITSEGQLVIYKGTDPSNSSAWLLVGVWNVGEPLGRRCFCKVESDLVVLTVAGALSLSAVMLSGQVTQKSVLTDRITQAMAEAAADYRDNFGWQLLYYPQNYMLILNVPINETGGQQQYVMNTITKRWGGPFKSVGAACWALLDREPYFGGDGYVGQFWDTFQDAGAGISFECQQANSYLGAKGVLKHVKAARPSILASGSFELKMGMNADYSRSELFGAVTFSNIAYGIWDTGTWDNALWGGGLVPFNNWQTVGAVGVAISPRMKGEVSGVEWRYQALDLVYEPGGIIG